MSPPLYSVRPLRRNLQPTGIDPGFKASWSDTQELLRREAEHLGARQIIIEAAVREQDIRQDGMLRAQARPAHQGVAVILTRTRHGRDMRLQARLVGAEGGSRPGRDVDWKHNVRAIALTLEALRRVERYGTTPSSEQYSGFLQLPAGGRTQEDLVALGAELVKLADGYRQAVQLHHPDRGGARDDWEALQAWKAAQ